MGKICDPPPFTGGQCRIRYTVLYDITNSDGITERMTRGDLSSLSGRFTHISYDDTNPTNNQAALHNDLGQSIGLFRSFSINNWGKRVSWSNFEFIPPDGFIDNCGDPPPINCRCSEDSCRVDCATAPDGFCCIDHSLTNRLLQVLQN